MSKGGILIFTDLHAHNFPDCSTLVEEGVNSRLLDCIFILTQLEGLAQERQVGDILFGGDLFHIPGKREDSVNNLVRQALQKLCLIASVYLITGNHDQASRRGFPHALEGVAYPSIEESDIHGVHVYDSLSWLYMSHYKVCLMPYRRVADDVKRNLEECHKIGADINLIHQGLSGVPVGKGNVVLDETLAPADLPTEAKWNLLGHYHETKFVNDNTIFLGAPLQHNWGDEGTEKWVWYLKEDGELEAIALQAPRFVTAELGDEGDLVTVGENECDFLGNFVRLRLAPMEPGLIEEYRSMAFAQGAKYVKVEGVEEQTELSAEVIEAPVLTNPREAVQEYLEDTYTGNLNVKRLVDIGVQELEGK